MLTDLAKHRRCATALRMTAVIILLVCSLVTDATAARRCRIQVLPLAFGTYVPATAVPLDSTGSISVRCNGNPRAGQPSAYILRIDGGLAGNPGSRSLFSGTDLLLYNLYKNSSRTDIWGDGTGGTTPLIQTLPASNRVRISHSVYGRIDAGYDPRPGLYNDMPIVTIEF